MLAILLHNGLGRIMMLLSKRYSCFTIVTTCFLLFNSPLEVGGQEKILVEKRQTPKKAYKNPFASLQKQRAVNQEKRAKALLKATPKPGVKTKRDPNMSNKVVMYGKKIDLINGKIQKKYINLVKGYSRIPLLKANVKALNERLKMTSSTDSTMNQINKTEADILKLKEEFQARVIAFEPIPRNLLDGQEFTNNPQYTWLKEFDPN